MQYNKNYTYHFVKPINKELQLYIYLGPMYILITHVNDSFRWSEGEQIYYDKYEKDSFNRLRKKYFKFCIKNNFEELKH